MAEDLDTLNGQLVALRAARASGVFLVEYTSPSGVTRHIRYKHDTEMVAAIGDLERRIATLAGTRRVRSIVVRNAGGW